jgi:seryl-tRNA synthetase
MSKLIAPPQIGGVHELLDLISNPDKYQEYMEQLVRMRDEVVARLGDLDNKEKADTYMAIAQNKMDEIKAIEARLAKKADDLAERERRLADKVDRINAIVAE